jgi:hypothetical protein
MSLPPMRASGLLSLRRRAFLDYAKVPIKKAVNRVPEVRPTPRARTSATASQRSGIIRCCGWLAQGHIQIEFDDFCAVTIWRHAGAYFFESIRYVLRSDNDGSLRWTACAPEILGSPPRHQSDVGPQPIGQQSSRFSRHRWRVVLLKYHSGLTYRERSRTPELDRAIGLARCISAVMRA